MRVISDADHDQYPLVAASAARSGDDRTRG